MFSLKFTSTWAAVFIYSSALFAQIPYANVVPAVQAIPSPEVVGQGRFVQFPRANRTGVPVIGIPLYQINDRGTSLPIGLAYHARGIKVNQIAGWVGMGWSLQAGGVITRTVKGRPDDLYEAKPVGLNPSLIEFAGWLDLGREPAGKVQRWPFINEWTEATKEDTAASECVRYVDGTELKILDTEPDIFYINTPTISAKFILDSLRLPRLLEPDQDLEIDYTTSWNSNPVPPYGFHDSIMSFTVTDANGIQYIFDQIESNTASSLKRAWDREDWANGIVTESRTYTETTTMTTAWFLSKIKFMNESEIDITYHDLTQQMTFHQRDERGACTSGGDDCTNNGDCENLIPLNHVSTEQVIRTKRVKEINSPNTRITFSLSGSDREDLYGGKYLESVTVYAKHNGEERQVKSFHFDYEYKTSPGYQSGMDIMDFKRLFLTSVQENQSSPNAPPPYVFTYDKTALPFRDSPEQDFWGYYNNNGASEMIPQIYCYPEKSGADRYRNFPLDASNFSQDEFIFKGADRTVNEDVITAGMLTQIKYPTCGTSDYIYEPNEYYDEGAKSNLKGGGIRIREVIKYDGVSHDNDIRKIYTYASKSDPDKSSGLLVNKPIFATGTGIAWNPDDPVGFEIGRNRLIYGPHSTGWCDEKKWNVFTLRIADSYTPLSDLDGVQVAYTHVTVHHEGAGKTSYEYFPPRTYQTHATEVKSGVSLDYNMLNTNCSSNDLNYGNAETGGNNIFPFPALSQDATFTWGKLKSTSHYDESGTLASVKTYNYSNYYLNGTDPHVVYGVVQGRHYAACVQNFSATWSLPRAWAKYTYQTDAVAVVSEVVERTYDQDLTADFVETTTKLFHESNHHMLLTKREVTNSDGTVFRTLLKYAPDYEVSGADASTNSDLVLWGLNKLSVRHHYNPVIEQETWEIKQGDVPRLVAAKLSTYQRIGNTAVPYELHRLETLQPLTDFTSSEMSPAKIFTFDARYDRKITNNKYNGYGNVIHQIDQDGRSISTVWGYNGSLPVATAFNAKRNVPIVAGIPGLSFGYIGFEAENESSSKTYNDFWDFYQDNEFSNDAHTGEVSRKVVTTFGPTRNFEPENQGQQFLFSAWVKSGPDFTQGELTVYSIADDGSTTLYPNISEAYITVNFGNTNGEWQYVEAVIDLAEVREVGNIPPSEKLRLRCFPWSTDNEHYFLVDDIRFSPYHAEVSYSAYEPLVGVTARSNTQDRVTYFNYNDIGKLLQVKNHKNEIVQEYEYQLVCGDCVVQSPPVEDTSDITIYDSSMAIINYSHDQMTGISTVEVGGGVPTHRTHWTVEQNSEVVEEVYRDFPVDTFIQYFPTQITHQWELNPELLSPCDGYQVNFELMDECGLLAKVKVADYPPSVVPTSITITGASKDSATLVSNVTIAGGMPPYTYDWKLMEKGVALETATHVSGQPLDQWQPDLGGIGGPPIMGDSGRYSIFTTITDYCHQQTATEVLAPSDTLEITRSYHDPTRMVSSVNFQKGTAPYQVNWQLIENGQVIEQQQLMSPVPESTWEATSQVTQNYSIISTVTDAGMRQVSKTVYDSTGNWDHELGY